MAWASSKEGDRVGVGPVTEHVGEQKPTWKSGAGVGKRYGSCQGEAWDGRGQTYNTISWDLVGRAS